MVVSLSSSSNGSSRFSFSSFTILSHSFSAPSVAILLPQILGLSRRLQPQHLTRQQRVRRHPERHLQELSGKNVDFPAFILPTTIFPTPIKPITIHYPHPHTVKPHITYRQHPLRHHHLHRPPSTIPSTSSKIDTFETFKATRTSSPSVQKSQVRAMLPRATTSRSWVACSLPCFGHGKA